MQAGLAWHYVGPSSLDPTAESMALQCVDANGKICGEKYILFKLKKDEHD